MSTSTTPTTSDTLQVHLTYLKLMFIREHFEPLATEATQTHWGHVDYLARLIEGEALDRQQRAIQRRLRLARFPVIKTLESF
jgi:DNA replication protein DnaC